MKHERTDDRRGPITTTCADRVIAIVLVLAAAVSLAACSVRERPSGLTDIGRWHSPLVPDHVLEATIRSTYRAKTAAPLEVLCLTGGGANGAWGAGLLCGWRDHRAGRPKFDIVAGVSTGALIAVNAFLGEPSDDEMLLKSYTEITQDDIFQEHFLLAVPFKSSYADSEPLAALIAARITDAVVDRVAVEAKAGRLFLVGTVNLDEGSLVVWNMTEIAAGGAEWRYRRFREILLASSSFPILMPPIVIDEYLHADGALRGRHFTQRIIEPLVDECESRPELPRPVVHVIVNGRAGIPVQFVRDRILDVGKRALNVLLDDNIVGAIDTARRLAKTGGLTVHLSQVPDSVELPLDPAEFDTTDMRALFEHARRFGRGDKDAGAWETFPPQ